MTTSITDLSRQQMIPQSSIERCANETLVHIFSYLTRPTDFVRCALVCTRWRACISNRTLENNVRKAVEQYIFRGYWGDEKWLSSFNKCCSLTDISIYLDTSGSMQQKKLGNQSLCLTGYQKVQQVMHRSLDYIEKISFFTFGNDGLCGPFEIKNKKSAEIALGNVRCFGSMRFFFLNKILFDRYEKQNSQSDRKHRIYVISDLDFCLTQTKMFFNRVKVFKDEINENKDLNIIFVQVLNQIERDSARIFKQTLYRLLQQDDISSFISLVGDEADFKPPPNKRRRLTDGFYK